MHGGFWREEYDRAHVAPLAEALARDGFHVANLEYPRDGMPGGGWPGDRQPPCSPASRPCTRTPTCPTASSSSATAPAGTSRSGSPRRRVPWLTGVVALAPAADLGEVDRLGLSNDAARALLGGTPDEAPTPGPTPTPRASTSPCRPSSSPASSTTSCRRSVTDSYVASRAPGEPLRPRWRRRADHFDVIDPTTDAYLLVLAEIEELTLTTH